MKVFPCERIGIDAQGGGVAVEEALHDPSRMLEGENLIWPIIDYDKPKETDDQAGLHILELVQFAKADWTAEANHGLRKDFEDKVLLFPRFDDLSLGLSIAKEGGDILDTEIKKVYDNETECILEIEDLKDELTTIVMTQTSTGVGGRDKWDTPDIKLPNGKKGKLRKDRYSALVIANMIARQMNRELARPDYNLIGANLRTMDGKEKDEALYKGPQWFTEGMDGSAYQGIYR